MREHDTHSNGILVTGATGNVGSEVCRHLASSGRPVAGAIRRTDLGPNGDLSAQAAARLHGATPRVFDFTNERTWAPALEGMSSLFLMRPPHISKIRRDMEPFIAYLRDRGIEHVVFLSVQGVENNPIVPHYKVEQAILRLGIPYTFVRPAFFMQNLSTTHLPEIRDEHRIFVPAGSGTTNFIDVRDIGEAMAAALTDVRHRNQAYTVTGRENYTYDEVAEHLIRVLGVRIRYEPAGLVSFLRYQLGQGRTLGHALVMYALYSVTRLGKAGTATDTFEEIVGRPPRTLDEFVEDHREVFRGTARLG